jgi:DNA-binding beta-propeller fold protein YncE
VGVGSVGAVDLRQAANGASIATVPTSEPVIKISVSSGGNTFFALQAGADGASVAVISAQSHRVVSTVPVPATATQVIGAGSGDAFWILLPGGVLEEFDGSPNPITEFNTGQGGSGLALSPDGQTMAVLRSGTVSNIALVSLATQSVLTVVPAPGETVDVVVSLDGHTLYVAASPSGTSNVQAIPFPTT